MQVRRDGTRGILYITQVRLAALVEGRGDADEDCVHFAKASEIGCRIEMLCIDVSSDFFGGNVLDVGLAGIQLFNLGLIEIESRDVLADVGKPERERKSHVAAADDSDLDAFVRKEFWLPLHIYSLCLSACEQVRKMHSIEKAMIAGVRKVGKQ